MINTIHKIHKVSLRILDIISGILMVGMLSFVVIQVVARYFFVVSTPWTEEGARMIMIWICFVGAASMMIRGEHLMVDVFYHKFSKKTKRYIRLIFDVVTLAFAFFLTFYSIKVLQKPMIRKGTTTVCHLPLTYYYGSLLFCMAIITVYEVLDCIESVYNIIHKIDKYEKTVDDIVAQEGGNV